MKDCPMCYRRERRELGLCLECDSPVVIHPANGRRTVYCADHLKPYKPRKKRPVKKHVLTLATFRRAKEMLAVPEPCINEIAKAIGVSRAVIYRVRNGEYDSYFNQRSLRKGRVVT